MSVELEELERELLGNPFDDGLRARYANALLEARDVESAETQFSLLLNQNKDNSAAHIGLAKCAIQRNDLEAARASYEDAKGCDDFSPDAHLERTFGDPPKVRAVEMPDNVVELLPSNAGITTFADVAGMEKLKKTLRLQIIEPFRNPGLFQRFRKKAGGGDSSMSGNALSACKAVRTASHLGFLVGCLPPSHLSLASTLSSRRCSHGCCAGIFWRRPLER